MVARVRLAEPRRLAAAALDQGEKPSVVSAIAKYHVTERARLIINDGMDVVGGKGVCMGPGNFLARAYQQIPVAITVDLGEAFKVMRDL